MNSVWPRGAHAGRERHRGLAAADVALKQTLHGGRRSHGLEEHAYRPLLRGREREGQRSSHLGENLRTIRHAGRGTLPLGTCSLLHQSDLQNEKLLEGNPALCWRGSCHKRSECTVGNGVGRPMHKFERLRHLGQAELDTCGLTQKLWDLVAGCR